VIIPQAATLRIMTSFLSPYDFPTPGEIVTQNTLKSQEPLKKNKAPTRPRGGLDYLLLFSLLLKPEFKHSGLTKPYRMMSFLTSLRQTEPSRP
jgi:hypothetical protein